MTSLFVFDLRGGSRCLRVLRSVPLRASPEFRLYLLKTHR